MRKLCLIEKNCPFRFKFLSFSFWRLYMTPPLKAGYYTVSEKLYVVAWGKTGSIEMEIYHPTQTSIQTDVLIWYHPDPGYCWRYLASSNTEIFITKLDTISKIVSGRFQFVGYCGGDDSTNTKQITQGRFDIKLNEISNN